jgi:hypothetical protein
LTPLATGFVSCPEPASRGALQQEKVSARSGHWVLACFMERQDGRDHAQLGMERIIHIVERAA